MTKLWSIRLQFVGWHCDIFLSVCLALLLKKIQSNESTDLDAVFAKWLFTALTQTLSKLVTLGQMSRSQWCSTHFSSFGASNLIPKMSYDILGPQKHLGRFAFKFYENRVDGDVIVTSFTFSPNNCRYIKFYWTYKLRTLVSVIVCDIWPIVHFVTFDLRLCPSSSVKVTFIFIIRWTFCCCVLVPSTNFVVKI